MPWSTEWAPTTTELNACVECGLCLPHCPTFRLTGDETASPRGRLNAMAAVAKGIVEIDTAFADVIGFCLQCRACEAACPSLVPFGRAMEGARAEVAAALPEGRLRRSVAGRWVNRRLAMRWATLGAALAQRIGGRRWLPRRLRIGLGGLRKLPLARRSLLGRTFDPDGEPVGTVGFLAGCVMGPWFDDVNRAVIGVLTAAGYRVTVPEGQGCCGALASHEGAPGRAESMARVNEAAFGEVDLLVADAAGCSAHLGEHPIGVPAEDAVVAVARLLDEGRLPQLAASGRLVGVQDPCHHQHVQGIHEEPRRILRAAGLRPIDVDPSGMCCGAAGLYSVAHPDAARELGRRKAEEIARITVGTVATANPGCEIQMRGHVGNGIRLAHPIELYAEAVGIKPAG
jgi:glycolate oxidase iron-sulfur subunit